MKLKHQLRKKSFFLALLTLTIGIASGNASTATALSPSEQTKTVSSSSDSGTTLALYNLKTPVKKMHQWSIGLDVLADNPGLNPTTPSAVEAAIEEGILDEMSTSVTDYEFNQDSTVKDWITYSGTKPVKVFFCGWPGCFDITYSNGLPSEFILDRKAFDEAIENGMILDAFDLGFERFTITYDANGLPKSLSGKTLPFFGGSNYTIIYSDYKFDGKGNWVKRKATSPYHTEYQYRCYEY